jgi:hypothetical protein
MYLQKEEPGLQVPQNEEKNDGDETIIRRHAVICTV